MKVHVYIMYMYNGNESASMGINIRSQEKLVVVQKLFAWHVRVAPSVSAS